VKLLGKQGRHQRGVGLLEVELNYHVFITFMGARNTKCKWGKEYGKLRVHCREATKNLRAWKTAGL